MNRRSGIVRPLSPPLSCFVAAVQASTPSRVAPADRRREHFPCPSVPAGRRAPLARSRRLASPAAWLRPRPLLARRNRELFLHRRAISPNLTRISAIPSGRWNNQRTECPGGRRTSRPKNCEQQVANKPQTPPLNLPASVRSRSPASRSLAHLARSDPRCISSQISQRAHHSHATRIVPCRAHGPRRSCSQRCAQTLSCFSCNADLTDKGLAHRVLCVQIEVSYGQFCQRPSPLIIFPLHIWSGLLPSPRLGRLDSSRRLLACGLLNSPRPCRHGSCSCLVLSSLALVCSSCFMFVLYAVCRTCRHVNYLSLVYGFADLVRALDV